MPAATCAGAIRSTAGRKTARNPQKTDHCREFLLQPWSRAIRFLTGPPHRRTIPHYASDPRRSGLTAAPGGGSPAAWSCWLCWRLPAPAARQARAAPDSLAPLVKKVLPAVVNIAVTETVSGGEMLSELPPELRDTPLGREFRRRFGNQHEQVAGAGSGFIIDPCGIIVTNNHVVDHADKIVVSLTDGRQLPATVLGRDELTDVAVIKVQTAEALPSVAWGDSRKAEVGDWILAAGNPFGLGGSVSVGIISAEGRDLGPGRSTTSCSWMRRSIPATPADRCSTWTAR